MVSKTRALARFDVRRLIDIVRRLEPAVDVLRHESGRGKSLVALAPRLVIKAKVNLSSTT